MLIQDKIEEDDYTLPLNDICWIKIRDRVIYISHRPDSIQIETYDDGAETDSPLYEYSFPFTTDDINERS